MPFGIERLNWGEAKFEDTFDVSLQDLIETFTDVDTKECVHVGMSLGGYLGIARADLFEKVYAVYPGLLPLPREGFLKNSHKLHVFVPEHDNWCKIPKALESHLQRSQKTLLEGAYHSFMSLEKNKVAQVFRYEFGEALIPGEFLKNYKLSHKSLSAFANYEMLDVPLRSDAQARASVLNAILRDLEC